jgi:electron transport complex protein RnfC
VNAAVQIATSRKIWPTPGGVHPPENKQQSLQLPLQKLAQPPEVILPLNQHIGAKAEPIVKVGDTVKKGQLVAIAKGVISANVHASISGKVSAIEARPIAHPSGMDDTCIVIANDFEDRWYEIIPCANYRQLHAVEILNRVEAAGVVGMGGAGFPTSVKLRAKKPISTLIINATECEPYITADDSLMRNDSENILEAIGLVDYLLDQPAEILVAIEDNKPEAIAIMQAAIEQCDNKRIEMVVLPTKYPSGGEKQLIQMLTGKEVASGQLPAQLGIVCQNVATVLAAYYAVVKGEPLISRVTTLSGEALARPQNLYIPLGTPIDFVLAQQGLQEQRLSRLVMGGPMMGFTLRDVRVPVVKTTNCILALSYRESPPPQAAMPCIRCGLCAEACPASLLPQQLYWYARAQDHDKLNAHHLFDCIECGACSYACPSHIPLVQYYRAAKAEIRHADAEKQQSDRARERFEFHKQRIEAEKQARAEARQLATEKAKQRQQVKPAPVAGSPVKIDAEDEVAKTERNLAGARDRLHKLQDKLQTLSQEFPDQVPALQARIKETELKCQNLSLKLEILKGKASDKIEPSSIVDMEPEPVKTLTTNQQQLAQWQLQLQETKTRIIQADPSNTDTIAGLQLSENILQQKIDAAEVVESTAELLSDAGPVSEASDPLQRAMENAMLKSSRHSNPVSDDTDD